MLEHPTAESLQGAVTKTSWSFKEGRVDVVGSDSDLIRFDAWTGKRAFVPKLARAMKRLEGYDVVVIDCPPSLGALTRDQIVDIWGRDLPQIVDFDRAVQAMDADRASIAQAADEIVERWRKLPSKQADALADLVAPLAPPQGGRAVQRVRVVPGLPRPPSA